MNQHIATGIELALAELRLSPEEYLIFGSTVQALAEAAKKDPEATVALCLTLMSCMSFRLDSLGCEREFQAGIGDSLATGISVILDTSCEN